MVRVAARFRNDVHVRAAGLGFAQTARAPERDFLKVARLHRVAGNASAAARRADVHAVDEKAPLLNRSAVNTEDDHRRRQLYLVGVAGDPRLEQQDAVPAARGRRAGDGLAAQHDLT